MVKRQPPNKRCVKQWSEEARDALRDCFDTTDWEVLCGPHEQDIDSLTDCITDYINFCVETVPTKRVRCFSNNKPWVTPDLRALLLEKRTAFQSGDRNELRRVQRDLKRKIKECKASYRRKMEDHLQQNNARESPKTSRPKEPNHFRPVALTSHLMKALKGFNPQAPPPPDFTYSTDSCHLQKFSDDTAIVGCVSEGNDCEYRKVIMDFVDWCELNHLQVNASKTKGDGDSTSAGNPHPRLHQLNIQGLDIERVRTYKYLGVHLNNKLDWTDNTDSLYKKVVCWGGGCSERDKKRLNRLIKRASSVCGCPLDSIEVMGERRALAKLSTIMDNNLPPSASDCGGLKQLL
ncbi:hypothetical protein L3Q82_008883, partial [Scortum barcoo]